MFMRYRGGGVGHQAVREATNSFLKDRPREELAAQIDARATTKDKNEYGHDGESEDELAEPALRTERIDLEDIPRGDEIEEEVEKQDEEDEEDDEEDGEETESASDDEESDEADSDGEADDTSRYAEL